MTELSLSSKSDTPLVIGLGFFDCVHAGHRKLLNEVCKLAKEQGAVPCASTFSNNPYRMFNPNARVVNTYLERLSLFASLGITHTLPLVFDAEFKKMSKDAFLDTLFGALNIRAVVCGYDYLFGNKAEGDAAYLTRYAAARGVPVKVVDPVLFDGERISTTAVKTFLENGEIERANRLLAAPFFMRGTVVRGRGKGAECGFPTANLSLKKSKLLPPDGVYKTRTEAIGKTYPSLTHIGPKPTFSDISVSVETYIDGFSGDLYDREIKVEFLQRLREVEKFASPDALAAQIRKDLTP